MGSLFDTVIYIVDIVRNLLFVALCSFESPEECSKLHRGCDG